MNVEQYERMRSQALTADPLAEYIEESPARTKIQAGESECRASRPSEQPEPCEFKGDRERVTVVLADLVLSTEEEQGDG